MKSSILKSLSNHISLFDTLSRNEYFVAAIEQAVVLCIEAFKKDKKVLLCGNGGSAADAQHIAAELSGRFKKDRRPLFAEALHVNTSYLTAVSNDYNFDQIYSRAIQAKGREGDILIAISTSGNSRNVLLALEEASKLNLKTITLTGLTGGKMKTLGSVWIPIPSEDTARIQEAHIFVGHMLCELVEQALFP